MTNPIYDKYLEQLHGEDGYPVGTVWSRYRQEFKSEAGSYHGWWVEVKGKDDTYRIFRVTDDSIEECIKKGLFKEIDAPTTYRTKQSHTLQSSL